MFRFQSAQPQTFRNGDLVELQVSFVAIPLRGERYKMVTVLRSIALLDGRYGQVSGEKIFNFVEKSDNTLPVDDKKDLGAACNPQADLQCEAASGLWWHRARSAGR